MVVTGMVGRSWRVAKVNNFELNGPWVTVDQRIRQCAAAGGGAGLARGSGSSLRSSALGSGSSLRSSVARGLVVQGPDPAAPVLLVHGVPLKIVLDLQTV